VRLVSPSDRPSSVAWIPCSTCSSQRPTVRHQTASATAAAAAAAWPCYSTQLQLDERGGVIHLRTGGPPLWPAASLAGLPDGPIESRLLLLAPAGLTVLTVCLDTFMPGFTLQPVDPQ
jgi:hypothetical protein